MRLLVLVHRVVLVLVPTVASLLVGALGTNGQPFSFRPAAFRLELLGRGINRQMLVGVSVRRPLLVVHSQPPPAVQLSTYPPPHRLIAV